MKKMKIVLTFIDADTEKPIGQSIIGDAWNIPEQAKEMLKTDNNVIHEVSKTISENVKLHCFVAIERLLKQIFYSGEIK